LSAVYTERSEVSIQEMYDLAEIIQGQGANVLIETAGSLRGGRDVWLLLKLNEPIQIDGDPNGETISYFALQNSFVTGRAFRAQAINMRIVCANTSAAADVEAELRGTNLVFSHSKNLGERLEEARDALAHWRSDIRAWKLAKEFMLTQPVSTQGVNWFVNEFIPAPDGQLTTDRVKANIEAARLELIGELMNPRNEGIEMTALGLFEAASSWNEHVRAAQSPQTRFARSIINRGTVLEQARDLALEAVNV